jgi:hypothetical protein
MLALEPLLNRWTIEANSVGSEFHRILPILAEDVPLLKAMSLGECLERSKITSLRSSYEKFCRLIISAIEIRGEISASEVFLSRQIKRLKRIELNEMHKRLSQLEF